MMETPRYHFLRQSIMSFDQGGWIEEAFIDVTGKRLAFVQTTGEHMALDVFPQEMPVTHIFGIYHPHPHINSPICKKRINTGYTDQRR